MTDFEKAIKKDILIWAMSRGYFVTKDNQEELSKLFWEHKLK